MTANTTTATNANEVRELLLRGGRALHINLQQKQLDQLLQHIDLLRQWNSKINLTAITDPKQMVIEHILDSLAIQPYLKGSRCLDIGSGAGFPGVPLAILFPDSQWTLLDSRQKKVAFLNQVIMRLGLKNTHAVAKRVENQHCSDFFDTLVARAFASIGDLIELTTNLQAKRVRMLVLKGGSFENELEKLSACWRAKIVVQKLKVPFLKAQRNLIIIDF